MRILVKNISNDILYQYKNIDNSLFHIIRDESFAYCLQNKFLDVKSKAPLEIYNKIEIIYNKIIH